MATNTLVYGKVLGLVCKHEQSGVSGGLCDVPEDLANLRHVPILSEYTLVGRTRQIRRLTWGGFRASCLLKKLQRVPWE